MQGILPITANGIKKLREELARLKNVERPRIITAIAEARAHGDLKENAEYHAAKEEQSIVESKILGLEDSYARARVMDKSKINTSKSI